MKGEKNVKMKIGCFGGFVMRFEGKSVRFNSVNVFFMQYFILISMIDIFVPMYQYVIRSFDALTLDRHFCFNVSIHDRQCSEKINERSCPISSSFLFNCRKIPKYIPIYVSHSTNFN